MNEKDRCLHQAIMATMHVVCPQCEQDRGSLCRTVLCKRKVKRPWIGMETITGRELELEDIHAERIAVWQSLSPTHFVRGELPSLGKRR